MKSLIFRDAFHSQHSGTGEVQSAAGSRRASTISIRSLRSEGHGPASDSDDEITIDAPSEGSRAAQFSFHQYLNAPSSLRRGQSLNALGGSVAATYKMLSPSPGDSREQDSFEQLVVPFEYLQVPSTQQGLIQSWATQMTRCMGLTKRPVVVVDRDLRIMDWSAKLVDLTGFTAGEVMGHSIVTFVVGTSFGQHVALVFEKLFWELNETSFEFHFNCQDRDPEPVSMHSIAKLDDHGKAIAVMCFGDDLDRKRRESEDERRLLDVVAANEAKSQFLATMSHEMRTPLNVVLGMNQLLMESSLTLEQLTLCQTIKNSSESLLVLINDILDLTKIESGKLELTEVEFDLRSLVEETISSIASKAQAKGLVLCHFMSPKIYSLVKGDPDRLRQVILNLLSNAIKFTAMGQVLLSVEVEDVSATHQTFRFKVYDSGIGISHEDQRKLFSRFTQVDASTTRTYGGTGLGLAISKQIAELMSGSIGVNSSMGFGSCFWFTAVLKKSEGIQPVYPAISLAGETLIVCSNETLRDQLNRYCEDVGLRTRLLEGFVETAVMFEEGDKETISQIICWLDVDILAADQGTSKRKLVELWMEDLEEVLCSIPWAHCIVLTPIAFFSEVTPYKDELDLAVMVQPITLAGFHQCMAEYADESEALFTHHESRASSAPDEEIVTVGRRMSVTSRSSSVSDGRPSICRTASANSENRKLRVLLSSAEKSHKTVLKAILQKEGHEVSVLADGSDIDLEAETWQASMLVLSEAVFTTYIQNCDEGSIPILLISSGRTGSGFSRTSSASQNDDLGEPGHHPRVKHVLSMPVDRENLKSILYQYIPGIPRTSSKDFSQSLSRGPSMSDNSSLESVPRTQSTDKMRIGIEQVALRVLIVDDDAGQRLMLSKTMEKWNCHIDTADDGSQAVRACARIAYDLILMDGFMPIMNGWQAAAEIREIEKLSEREPAVILGLSGAGGKDDQNRFMQSGMTQVLLKPITKATLDAVIRQHVSRWHALQNPGQEADEAGAGSQGMNGTTIAAQVILAEEDVESRREIKGIINKAGVDVIASTHHLSRDWDEEEVLDVDAVVAGKSFNATLGLEALLAMREKERQMSAHSKPFIIVTPLKSNEERFVACQLRLLTNRPVSREDLSAQINSIVTPYRRAAVASQNQAAKVKAPHPKVLIAEDHAVSQKLLAIMLRKMGCEVSCVDDGQKALEICCAQPFDAVLMDCNMPNMDGWTAASRIRETAEPNKTTPIIAVTANAMKGDRDKCLAAGMDDYLTKPVNKRFIRTALEKWMGMKLFDPTSGEGRSMSRSSSENYLVRPSSDSEDGTQEAGRSFLQSLA